MRLVRLARVAAAAEKLRLRRLARRQALRAVYAAAGAVFAIALIASLHVAAGFALAYVVAPVWAALIVAAVDLVIAGALLLIALNSSPDRIELEATRVSQEARSQMAEAAMIAGVVAPMARRVGWGVVDRVLSRTRR